MGQLEAVALWTGLFASIAGIVLSIVAIVFAVLVNRRSQEVSDQTIQSLQKIESTVGQLSEDTRELIKAGWDKMLGSVGRQSLDDRDGVAAASAEELAEGVAAELRAQLGLIADSDEKEEKIDGQSVDKLESVIKSLESSLSSQIENLQDAKSPSAAIDRLLARVDSLSLAAQALLRNIQYRHIELKEYRRLLKGPLGDALKELRESGLLVPVVHTLAEGEKVPCYYYPKGISKLMSAAMPLMDDLPKDLLREIREELVRAGYPRDALAAERRNPHG